MQTYREPARDVPVVAEVDVLVVGGGPSGFAAAVAAARAGAATMLVEQTGAVGGVATSGMMSHWTVGGAVPGTDWSPTYCSTGISGSSSSRSGIHSPNGTMLRLM